MRALVTGSNGFVGKHLIRHLQESGDEVLGIDREYDADRRDRGARGPFDVYVPDTTYHLAALTHVGASRGSEPTSSRASTWWERIEVLDAAYEVAPSSTTIVVSTSEVYGIVSEDDLPLVETFRVAPANPYSASKVEAENVAHDVVRRRGQRVVVARPFNHLGPGQSVNFVVPALISRLLDAKERGDREIPVGDLSTRRDFCDVRDVVRAYRLLAQYGLTGEAYNVASGHDVLLSDLCEQLVQRIAPEITTVVDAALLRPVEIPVFRGSYEKLHHATGWSPQIPLDQTLNDVITDLESRRRTT